MNELNRVRAFAFYLGFKHGWTETREKRYNSLRKKTLAEKVGISNGRKNKKI